MTELKFRPLFRVVPNKVSDEGRLRATLLVAPEVSNAPDAFSLKAWPSSVAKIIAEAGFKHSIIASKAVSSPVNHNGKTCHTMPKPGVPEAIEAHAYDHEKLKDRTESWKGIDRDWQAQLESAAADQAERKEVWIVLSKLLKQKGGQFNIDMNREGPNGDHLGNNGEIMSSMRGTEEQGVKINTVLSVRHGILAKKLQEQRGAAVAKALEAAGVVPNDLVRTDATQTLDEVPTTNGQDGTPENVLSRVKNVQTQAFVDAVSKTTTERERAAEYYEKLSEALIAGTCESLAAVTPPEAPSNEGMLAAHDYGTHPESSVEHRHAMSNDNTVGSASKATLRDKVAGIYFSIESSPALARVFNLAIDIEFDVPSFADKEGASTFFIASAPPDSPEKAAGPVVHTSARLTLDKDKAKQFLSATRQEMAAEHSAASLGKIALQSQTGGVTLLRAPMPGNEGETRYQISALDIRHALNQDTKNEDTSVRDREARYKTAGLTLSDCAKEMEVIEELAFTKKCEEDCVQNPQAPVLLYAEDLTVGHIIDVAMRTQNGDQWRCLMERFVLFDGLNNPVLFAVAGGEGDVRRRMELERAVNISTRAREMPREKAPEDGKRKVMPVDVIVEEALATWDGEPLGFDTSAMGASVESSEVMERRDLSLHIRRRTQPPRQYDNTEIRPIPPLRFGQSYKMGVRSVFAGGGSLSLPEAEALYNNTDVKAALPGPGEGAFTFRRNESLMTPYVLMPEEIALRKLSPMPFETSAEMILRSSIEADADKRIFKEPKTEDPYLSIGVRSKPDSTSRILMPPAISMEEGFRHGLFDSPSDGEDLWRRGPVPQVVFNDGFPEATEEVAGGFNSNEVVLNRVGPDGSGRSDGRGKIKQAGIGLFKLRTPPAQDTDLKPPGVYYPDPTAHRLVIALRPVGAVSYETGTEQGIPSFHKVDFFPSVSEKDAGGKINPKAYRNLHPVELVVRKARAGKATSVEIKENQTYLEGDVSIKVTRVTVSIAAGQQFQIDAWCTPNANTIEKVFALPQFMCDCAPDQKPSLPYEAGRLYKHVVSKGPIEQLSAATSILARHAVNRPLAKPSFVINEKEAIKVSRKDIEKQPRDYSVTGQVSIPLETSDTFELVAETVFPAEANFDVPSRGRTRAQRRAGKWPKTLNEKFGKEDEADRMVNAKTRTVFGFTVDETGRTKLPVSSVSLLRTDQLSFSRKNDGTIDLGVLFESARNKDSKKFKPDIGKAVLQHRFPDAKARKLRLKLLAMSRYASDFTTRRFFKDERDGGPEGKPRLLRKSQPLSANDQITVSEEQVEIWLPSAIRPEVCFPLTPEPSFVVRKYDTVEMKSGKKIHHHERRAPVRIRMKRPWFSSGEGERVGVVIYKPKTGEDWPPKFQRYITVWGADPVHPSGSVTSPYIPKENFNVEDSLHKPEWERDIKIRLPGQNEGKTDQEENDKAPRTFKADLLTLVPHFDIDREEWYVDLDIKGTTAASPFVQVALVRFQPNHSTEEFAVSDPVSVVAQVMPTRELEADAVVVDEGWRIEARLRGRTGATKDMPKALRDKNVDKTLLRMTLFHERKSEDGSQVNRSLLHTYKSDVSDVWRVPNDTTENWLLSYTIDREKLRKLGDGVICAYFEEIERYQAASYPVEPVSDEVAFEDIIETGPRFAARIDFPEITLGERE